MDADNSPARRSAQSRGGTVEPANRVSVAKGRFQTPADEVGERFELRDPFAEVTYRASTFPEIVAKADQLGSSRFIAVAEDGKRTTIRKVDGEWQRGPQRPAAPERPLDATPVRDEFPETTNVVPMPNTAKTPARPEQVDVKAIAKIDAQAERAALVARVEAALRDRYIIKRAPATVGDVTIGRTEYRFRGDTSRVAFTESTFRLATDTNSPSVARSMVDVAEARNWQALRLSGHEDFRRMVWLEASVRGVKTIGYEPVPGDMELLRKEREARQVNRIEPAAPAATAATTDKSSARGSGSRKTVLAAIEAVLVAQRVPEKRREAIMAAATDSLAKRLAAGEVHKVKVYDKAAPQQRPTRPMSEQQRGRERTTHIR